ncbi:MAG: hypothetical protein K940chlam2_00046 [Chlamydiae bacterium]|nr:hypothetical protein [Chlamydiota bacterium]
MNMSLAAGLPVDPGDLLMNAAAQAEAGGASAKIGSTGAVGVTPGSVTPVAAKVVGNDASNIVSLEHMQLKQQYDLLINAYNTLATNHEILVNRAAFLEKQVRENMPELANPIDLGDTITLPDGRKMSLADAVTWAATGGGAPVALVEETEQEEGPETEPEEETQGPEQSIAIG